MAELIPSKDKRIPLVPQSTPTKYRRSSGASHHVTPVSSSSIAVLTFLERNPIPSKTRFEQLEIEFLMALDALSLIQDSDDDSEENATESDTLFQNGTHQGEELLSRNMIAREKYKTELWSRDFEPVLQRIRAVSVAINNADLKESASSEAVRRLMACGSVIQKEKNVLDGLWTECMRIGAMLGDIGHFLGTLAGAEDGCGSWSDDLYGICENTDARPTQNREHERTFDAVGLNTELLETTSKSDSRTEEGIDFRAYCDDFFTALQHLDVNSNEDNPPTIQNDQSAASVFAPFITHLYPAVTEHITATDLRAENTSLIVARNRERKQLNATLAEVQCRNDEDLSLAAGLLVEAVQVQAQVEHVRAAAKADLGVSIKICEEVARRRVSFDWL